MSTTAPSVSRRSFLKASAATAAAGALGIASAAPANALTGGKIKVLPTSIKGVYVYDGIDQHGRPHGKAYHVKPGESSRKYLHDGDIIELHPSIRRTHKLLRVIGHNTRNPRYVELNAKGHKFNNLADWTVTVKKR